MATTSEIGQVVNGIETDKSEVLEKLPSKSEGVVKQLNAATDDSMKADMQTTQNENGESEEQKRETSVDNEHDTPVVSETPITTEEKPAVTVETKPVEATIDVSKPATFVETTSSTVEPMDAEPVLPTSVTTEEMIVAKPEETMAKPEEHKVEEQKPQESVPDATENPSEDVATAAEEKEGASEATTIKGGAKRGRKPGPKKSATTPKKTPAVAAHATELATTAEGETKEAEAAAGTEPISPKRTPKRKRELVSLTGTEKEESKTPLLEAPLIVEGKRTRQRVERLDSTVLTPDKRPAEVPEGKGTKLSDIPYIDAMISKSSTVDLKLLHRLAFGRVGTAHELKKHVRLFNGFDFEANSAEYEKKKKMLETAVLSDLKSTCGILGLEKGGKKEDLIEVILKFALEPVDMGKEAPQSASRRSSSTTRKSTGKRKTPTRGKKSEHSDEGESEHDEEHDEDAEHEEKEEPATKRGRKSKTTAASSEAAPSASKRAAPTKKAFPSDADIKSTIKELLKDVNLEQVTMKEMTAKVYDHYPNVDLTNKKEFIKDTVKALLSSSE